MKFRRKRALIDRLGAGTASPAYRIRRPVHVTGGALEFFLGHRETGKLIMDKTENAIREHRVAAQERARTAGDAQVRRLTVQELEAILENERARVEGDPAERVAALPLVRRCAHELARRRREGASR